MEVLSFLIAFLIIVGAYSLIVGGISSIVKTPGGRRPFWWIFFFWIFGIVIVLLLDIRDGVKEEKEA